MSLLVLFQGGLVTPAGPPPPVVLQPFGHGVAAIVALTGRAADLTALVGTTPEIGTAHGRRADEQSPGTGTPGHGTGGRGRRTRID